MKTLQLTPQLKEMVAQHIVLLQPLNAKNNRFKLETWTGGYQDLMYTIADLVKVSMLALEAADSCNFPDIPDANTNISGVLALILNMLPYEEAELLDILYKNCLERSVDEEKILCDESYFLTQPTH